MKIVIATALALVALGGCAVPTTTTSSRASDYPSAAPIERVSTECRGVYDHLARACIGG